MSDKTPAQELRRIAYEAFRKWDSDQDSCVGKMLRAIADPNFAEGYRADIFELHQMLEGIERDHEDAERFRALTEFDAVAINDCIVQARRGESWGTAYHKIPPAGVPKTLFDGDKLAALRAAIDAARGK